MDITSSSIACNEGGDDGTSTLLDVNAGSDMTFKWTNVRPRISTLCPQFYLPYTVGSLQWPADHLGPVTTFMASCNGDCSNFKATDGKWFKIDEGGYADGKWASQKLIAGASDCSSHYESYD